MSPSCRFLVVITTLAGLVSAKYPLYIGGLFPMTSLHSADSWTGGNGILPAAQIALAHVNSAGVLWDYELRMIWNDTGGFPGLAEHVVYDFLHTPPRKVMILGAGYSSCSTVVASLTGLDYWKIPQISYASTSPELSNKAFYPNFYRTIPADTSFNAPRIAILKEFNWSHAAIIYQEEDIHRAAVEHLQEEFLKNNIHRITSEGFRDSPATQMATLKKRDARIIFGNFFGSGARKVFCEAYKLGMYGSRYQWIILGYIEKNWWLPQGTYSDCTAGEVLKAANSLLMTDYLWHATDDMFTVSGKTVKRFFEEYDNKVPAALRDEHAGYAYDAVWTMALALNRSIARNPGLRLDLLPYGDNSTNHVMIQELALMNFTGVTVRAVNTWIPGLIRLVQ